MELHDKHSFALSASAANVKVVNNLSNLSTIAWSEDSWILGEGSNTVFTDDFKGQLILNRLRGHHITESASHYMVTLAAGENWHDWVCELVERGMLGFENLALIPGSVGAAPVQNIGAYGVEVSQFIKAVEGVDLATQQPFYFTADDCKFAYRDSIFKRPDRRSLCITQVHFALPKAWQPCLRYPDLQDLPDTASAQEILRRVVKVRQAKLPDPSVVPNAGSFFKNPVISRQQLKRIEHHYDRVPFFEVDSHRVKVPAAWLIDQSGLKSLRVGGASVHQRHALVLVNQCQASGDDLLNLARQVVKQVNKRFAIELEPEVRLMGERGLVEL